MSEKVWQRGRLVAEVRSDTADTIALLHLDADQPRVLNGSAAAIWMLVDGHRSQSQIVSELSERFDDPNGLISAQVGEFFSGLESEELIEQVPGERCSPGEPAGTGEVS